MLNKNLNILAIDTSLKQHSISLLKGENIQDTLIGNIDVNSSNNIISDIRDLLNRNDLETASIDLITASVGPGSFTGLKVGLSVVKGIALSNKIDIIGVPVFEALYEKYKSFVNSQFVIRASSDKFYNWNKMKKTNEVSILNLKALLEIISVNISPTVVYSVEKDEKVFDEMTGKVIFCNFVLSELIGQTGLRLYLNSDCKSTSLFPLFI